MPLDIGLGIIWPLLLSEIFGFEAPWWLILLGIIFALLPDIDIVPFLHRVFYDHRSWTHYPIIYVPIVVIMYVFFGSVYALLFTLGVFGHLMHDTIGIGWGIAWLWPFSKRKFLFPEKGRRHTEGFFMTWLPEEEPALGAKYHDPQWVKHYYLEPNWIGFVEYAVLIASLVKLYLYFK